MSLQSARPFEPVVMCASVLNSPLSWRSTIWFPDPVVSGTGGRHSIPALGVALPGARGNLTDHRILGESLASDNHDSVRDRKKRSGTTPSNPLGKCRLVLASALRRIAFSFRTTSQLWKLRIDGSARVGVS